MRLIDADRLKDTLVIMANKRGGSLDILDISDAILKAPTVERPHGEWVDTNGDGSIMKCSRCGEEVCCKDNNFCSNCGADMRKVR